MTRDNISMSEDEVAWRRAFWNMEVQERRRDISSAATPDLTEALLIADMQRERTAAEFEDVHRMQRLKVLQEKQQRRQDLLELLDHVRSERAASASSLDEAKQLDIIRRFATAPVLLDPHSLIEDEELRKFLRIQVQAAIRVQKIFRGHAVRRRDAWRLEQARQKKLKEAEEIRRKQEEEEEKKLAEHTAGGWEKWSAPFTASTPSAKQFAQELINFPGVREACEAEISRTFTKWEVLDYRSRSQIANRRNFQYKIRIDIYEQKGDDDLDLRDIAVLIVEVLSHPDGRAGDPVCKSIALDLLNGFEAPKDTLEAAQASKVGHFGRPIPPPSSTRAPTQRIAREDRPASEFGSSKKTPAPGPKKMTEVLPAQATIQLPKEVTPFFAQEEEISRHFREVLEVRQRIAKRKSEVARLQLQLHLCKDKSNCLLCDEGLLGLQTALHALLQISLIVASEPKAISGDSSLTKLTEILLRTADEIPNQGARSTFSSLQSQLKDMGLFLKRAGNHS